MCRASCRMSIQTLPIDRDGSMATTALVFYLCTLCDCQVETRDRRKKEVTDICYRTCASLKVLYRFRAVCVYQTEALTHQLSASARHRERVEADTECVVGCRLAHCVTFAVCNVLCERSGECLSCCYHPCHRLFCTYKWLSQALPSRCPLQQA